MPRSTRIDLPGLPQHLIVRGNNRSPLFFQANDRGVFLRYLGEACPVNDCDVHAFVLMTNHVHLLATSRARMGLSKAMQDIGRRYARYVNSAYRRTGTLYEGRFKSSLVETGTYLLTCMRYIELNPVRAGMARHPGGYPWSSFSQNVSGEPTGLVKPHAEYLQLGTTPERRGDAYLRLFEEAIPDRELVAIRESAEKSRALGSEAFCAGVEATLRRPVRVVRRGRPANSRPSPPNVSPFRVEN